MKNNIIIVAALLYAFSAMGMEAPPSDKIPLSGTIVIPEGCSKNNIAQALASNPVENIILQGDYSSLLKTRTQPAEKLKTLCPFCANGYSNDQNIQNHLTRVQRGSQCAIVRQDKNRWYYRFDKKDDNDYSQDDLFIFVPIRDRREATKIVTTTSQSSDLLTQSELLKWTDAEQQKLSEELNKGVEVVEQPSKRLKSSENEIFMLQNHSETGPFKKYDKMDQEKLRDEMKQAYANNQKSLPHFLN